MQLQLFVTLLLVILSWFLAQDIDDVGPFGWWTAAWAVMVGLLVLGGALSTARIPGALGPAASVAVTVLGTVQVPLFALGGRQVREGSGPGVRSTAWILGAAVLVGVAFGAAALLGTPRTGGAPAENSAMVAVQLLPRSLGLALVFPYCAQVVRRSSRFGRSGAGACVVVGFLLYGVNHAVYSAANLNEIAALLTGSGAPSFGGAIPLSPWAFRADVAWELLIGLGSVLLLRREGRKARRALDRSEQKYRRLFEDSADGILLADARYRVIDANSSLREALGSDEGELAGRVLPDLVAPAERDDFPSRDWVVRGDGVEFETVMRRVDGEGTFPAAVTLNGFRLDRREVVQAIVRDVTERKELERELTRRALHHPLTDLPNRYHFNRRVEEALGRLRRSGAPFALLFCDLDEFKEVNDTLGHSAGDELLREAADGLRRSVREADLVGHVGGDEFTVLLHGTATGEAVKRAGRRILDGVEGVYELERGTVRVSLSVGGAIAHRLDTSDQLMHRADTAMYRAKDDDGVVPVLERQASPSA